MGKASSILQDSSILIRKPIHVTCQKCGFYYDVYMLELLIQENDCKCICGFAFGDDLKREPYEKRLDESEKELDIWCNKLCTGSEDFKQVEALEDKKLEIAQFRAVLNLFKKKHSVASMSKKDSFERITSSQEKLDKLRDDELEIQRRITLTVSGCEHSEEQLAGLKDQLSVIFNNECNCMQEIIEAAMDLQTVVCLMEEIHVFKEVLTMLHRMITLITSVKKNADTWKLKQGKIPSEEQCERVDVPYISDTSTKVENSFREQRFQKKLKEVQNYGLDKIIAITSSNNTKEAEEKLHKLETELQNFNHSSESNLQECSRKIKSLEEEISSALKTGNQDVSLSAENREHYEIKQQEIDELMKTLEREKTRKEELQWHKELMTDEYSRVLKVAKTFQEKFKCKDCDDGKELWCRFQFNHREM